MGAGDSNSSLMIAPQMFYLLSHLPNEPSPHPSVVGFLTLLVLIFLEYVGQGALKKRQRKGGSILKEGS